MVEKERKKTVLLQLIIIIIKTTSIDKIEQRMKKK
jgi:hypothetical protein